VAGSATNVRITNRMSRGCQNQNVKIPTDSAVPEFRKHVTQRFAVDVYGTGKGVVD
jgi:hypothetical protein